MPHNLDKSGSTSFNNRENTTKKYIQMHIVAKKKFGIKEILIKDFGFCTQQSLVYGV